MPVLDPLSHALALLVAGLHTGLVTLGADPDSGLTWGLCFAAVVVVVRAILLPLVVQVVRNAHASACPSPLEAGERAIQGPHRPEVHACAPRRPPPGLRRAWRLASRLLPVLIQLPVWIALYHLLSDVAAGQSVGALDAAQVAWLGVAPLAGVPLTGQGYVGSGLTHLAVVAGLAGAAAVLGFVTQRVFVADNTLLADLPEAMAGAYRVLPFVTSTGLLVAGGFVPVALLGYWACGAVWTCAQTAVVWRWYPTPGSPAARRRSATT